MTTPTPEPAPSLTTRIITTLLADGQRNTMTARELAEALEADPRHVDVALYRLRGAGIVNPPIGESAGRPPGPPTAYTLTPDWEDHL